jgi:PAS domain S-box-containing protein/putative nucleotidyltransferase with HDIG domain
MRQVMVRDMKMNQDNFKVGRIMIVDDEAELMTALCEAVAGQGYEAKGFTTGADALKVLAEQDFDLLLTDLMMPEMDGIALLQAGLEIDPNLVGVIMTGHGTIQTAVEAIKTGAFDYILKPFKLGTLLPILSRAMEVRSLRMENIQLRETVAIHELGKLIAFSSDLNSILNKVADATLQQCKADEVSVMLPTRDGKELYVAVARGGHREYIGERVPMGRGIAGWVARNRETVIINGKVDDPRFTPLNPRTDIRAAVSMPMMAGGNLVGVLNVNITQGHRHLTLGQVKALSILVSIIAPVLENTWLNIQIRDAEERYRSIFDNAVDGIALADLETGELANCNQALCRMVEREKTELVGQAQSILHRPQEEIDGQSPTFQKHQEGDAGLTLEDTLLSKSGALTPVEIRAAKITLNGRGYLLGIFRDITERKRSEEALRESEQRFMNVLHASQDAILLIDGEKFVDCNEATARMLGYAKRDEFLMTHPSELSPPTQPDGKNSLEMADEMMKLAIKRGFHQFEWRHRRANGEDFPVEVSLTSIVLHGKNVLHCVWRDLTEQKRQEERLLRERSMVDRIMKTSPAGITVVDRTGQIVFANKRAEDIFCLTKNGITQRGYNASEWHITDFDGNPFPEEQLPFAQVMNTGTPVYGVRHAIELSGRRRVFLSINGAPIFDDQGHIGEVVLTIDDITKHRHAEEEIQQGIKQLEKSMGDTIKAMSMVVETRDPYTAGHQDKVARLAAAIAEKISLSEERIRGIKMAGVIHDIGKMYIPADILSKPGKLSSIEMQLIRTHSQAGYDIMKDIEFPWPVAKIILEHHERMDGSGYPNGKSNNDILLEARIIAVADVVDAIASHRPYRPSFGIDAALGEIEKNKGVLYDSDVVNACLKLFREEGFQLEGA